MNETKTKTMRVIKAGQGLVITLPTDFCRKAHIKKGDVLGLTCDSVVIIALLEASLVTYTALLQSNTISLYVYTSRFSLYQPAIPILQFSSL